MASNEVSRSLSEIDAKVKDLNASIKSLEADNKKLDYLDSKNIKYELVEHEEVHTIEDMKKWGY